MRFSTVFSCVTMLMIAPVASSNEPPPNPQQLGAATAVLDFCSKVDHDSDRVFDAGSERLFHGLAQREAERIRHTDAFRQAYSTLQSVLSELPANDAHAACEAIEPTILGKLRR
jgi:hypothetical protein